MFKAQRVRDGPREWGDDAREGQEGVSCPRTEEIMNETENETMAAEVEAVETVETEAAEVEAADEVSDEEEAGLSRPPLITIDEELMDKMQKAARLLRSRRFAISRRRRPRPSAWRTSSAPSSLTSSP